MHTSVPQQRHVHLVGRSRINGSGEVHFCSYKLWGRLRMTLLTYISCHAMPDSPSFANLQVTQREDGLAQSVLNVKPAMAALDVVRDRRGPDATCRTPSAVILGEASPQ